MFSILSEKYIFRYDNLSFFVIKKKGNSNSEKNLIEQTYFEKEEKKKQ